MDSGHGGLQYDKNCALGKFCSLSSLGCDVRCPGLSQRMVVWQAAFVTLSGCTIYLAAHAWNAKGPGGNSKYFYGYKEEMMLSICEAPESLETVFHSPKSRDATPVTYAAWSTVCIRTFLTVAAECCRCQLVCCRCLLRQSCCRYRIFFNSSPIFYLDHFQRLIEG